MRLHGTQLVNEQGHLEIGGCDTVELAQKYGTPLYIMDEAHIRDICRQYHRSFVEGMENTEVIYASKAFSTLAMCRIIDEEGLGLDVVSGGEFILLFRRISQLHESTFMVIINLVKNWPWLSMPE